MIPANAVPIPTSAYAPGPAVAVGNRLWATDPMAAPVIALNYPDAHKIGTVGKVLPNVECRFAEDGELEVKGPSIFIGYWKKRPELEESDSASEETDSDMRKYVERQLEWAQHEKDRVLAQLSKK